MFNFFIPSPRLGRALLLGTLLAAGVPWAQAAPEATPAADSPAAATASINLNTASAEQLQQLRGIGPAMAARIVDWREQEGPFTSVDQLMAIKGIGEKTLARFRDRLTL
ncbi:DNA uptake protein [Alcanivorax marinus]|nr:helix-hairpin-helix domain-containing protein [Alloalcanivorax marinus]MCU5788569.1 DNA uptake protein [Alloalcanivorax marinus]